LDQADLDVDAAPAPPRTLAPADSGETSIVTRMRFRVPVARAWDGLRWFEEVRARPPLALRLLLPTPLRVEGRKSQVGDASRCLYDRGHLVKQVTCIEPQRRLRFEILEQELAFGGGLRLLGGGYALRACSPRETDVELQTRYRGGRRPRWFWRRVEALLGHQFHRHLLRAMRRAVEPDAAAAEPEGRP